MPGTNLYMNWSGVAVTPAGGSVINLQEITDVEIDGKSIQKSFYGDARQFPRCLVNTAKTRTIKIIGGNPKLYLTIPEDKLCAITATFHDAVNGATAGGGGMKVDITGALRESLPMSGKNNEYGVGTLTFNCQSDPTTDADPITITPL